MGKALIGLIAVAGFWVGIELFLYGPSRAFDGALAGFFSPAVSEEAVADFRSTPERAGDAVREAQAQADARRERMLAEQMGL